MLVSYGVPAHLIYLWLWNSACSPHGVRFKHLYFSSGQTNCHMGFEISTHLGQVAEQTWDGTI